MLHAVMGNKEAIAEKRLMADIGKGPAPFTIVLFIYINHVLMCFSGSGPNCTTGFLSSGK